VTDTPNANLIEAELDSARKARLAGNEGKARVHARRAAGWAIGLGSRKRGGAPATRNAYRLLQRFSRDASADEQLRDAARRLTTRITEDHLLPHAEDPLQDAERIVRACLPDLGAK